MVRKILFGIPVFPNPSKDSEYIVDYEVDDEGEVWCDFELDYIPDRKCYIFEFETMLGFRDDEGCRKWLTQCLSLLTDYMKSHNLNTGKELNFYEVFTEGYNVNTEFKDIETAYAWLKLMVYGFHGQGLFMEKTN